MGSSIPDQFLRGPPPPDVCARQLFKDSSIRAYQDCFAAVIDNLFSEAECKELLRRAEQSTSAAPSAHPTPTWERAMVNAGAGKQVMSVDTRKSGRIIFDSPDLAQRLLDRMMPFMREWNLDAVRDRPLVTGLGPARRGETFRLARLNERLRFLRYEGGDYFRPHWDGCYVTPDGKERSLFTIHLYLNGEGEQDMEELTDAMRRLEKENGLATDEKGEVGLMKTGEEVSPQQLDSSKELEKLLGGATSFTDNYQGRAPGDDVFRGVKYTVRSDVMYTLAPGDQRE
ncbi:Prolyl 4-hydroxylase alpha subunit [Penicillium chermesinum]|uniref:Prolyl 4-hydroxylase alpha subunit n=1 Tax=Penicillium chermesinum TaxID=63820 RepID=A0A9W9NSA3_9EURO|nr:Prolyl 4-hydroxylase alpha subunit [Penicillium chermesinum]KAJ5225190.1 Prolyl 4-hydroxylase alpha subunit [Penicillium chermesinum]